MIDSPPNSNRQELDERFDRRDRPPGSNRCRRVMHGPMIQARREEPILSGTRLLVSGKILMGLALVTFIGGFAPLWVASTRVVASGTDAAADGVYMVWCVSAWLLSLGILWLGVRVVHRGRRRLVPTGVELLATDKRAPVLYLRSFQDDETTHSVFDRFASRIAYRTEEEELAAAFAEVGPCVAVGAPGEELPALGAARFYFDDETWKTEVAKLIQRARFVLLRASSSRGLIWELRTVVESLPPDRFLVVVGGRAAYDAFRSCAAEIMPVPLPPFFKKCRIGSMHGLLSFSPGFVPHAIALRRTLLRWSVVHPYLSELLLALGPVFTKQGLPFREPQLPKWKVLLLGLLTAIVVYSLTKRSP